jgi:hypothetical protein
MKATPADPRVIARETDDPAYWVILRRGTVAEEFRLTDVLSVHEVMAWAEAKAAGRSFQVFVEVEEGDQRHVLRLLGRKPPEQGGATRVTPIQ